MPSVVYRLLELVEMELVAMLYVGSFLTCQTDTSPFGSETSNRPVVVYYMAYLKDPF